MGEFTSISWTHATFNPWWGCTRVGGSPACGPAEGEAGGVCYAETWANRTGHHVWGSDAPRRFFGDAHWAEPLKWNRAAEKAGERRRVFCMSMGDWAEGRPDQAASLDRLWSLIEATPYLDWLMLTKRPQLIPRLYPWASTPCILENVWMGITAENQHWLDIRWPQLRQVTAAIYWLSIEPLFGPIRLPRDFLKLGKSAWVIVGGQSGNGAVMMHAGWAQSIRDQCTEAGVPFHFKQWGEYLPDQQNLVMIDNGKATTDPPAFAGIKMGKKAAGRLLDGRTWDEVPEVTR